MLESKVKSYLTSHLKKMGWLVILIIKTNRGGDPDVYTFKDGITVWIETKKAGKDLKPLQEYRKKEIKSFGMNCISIIGIKEAKEYIEQIKNRE